MCETNNSGSNTIDVSPIFMEAMKGNVDGT